MVEERSKSCNYLVSLQPFHLPYPRAWCCIPVIQALGGLERCKSTIKQKAPGDTTEINRSHSTVLQPQFPTMLAHRQSKRGQLQTMSRAKQHLHCTCPLDSTLCNLLHIYSPTQSICEIWVQKGIDLEALKSIYKYFTWLQTYFGSVF